MAIHAVVCCHAHSINHVCANTVYAVFCAGNKFVGHRIGHSVGHKLCFQHRIERIQSSSLLTGTSSHCERFIQTWGHLLNRFLFHTSSSQCANHVCNSFAVVLFRSANNQQVVRYGCEPSRFANRINQRYFLNNLTQPRLDFSSLITTNISAESIPTQNPTLSNNLTNSIISLSSSQTDSNIVRYLPIKNVVSNS